MLKPSPRSLGQILEQSGVGLPPRALERLWRYHGMLREANAELNLTRIHNFENMARKHYVDSLLVLRHLDLPSPLVDMGTGPGLPGIPLKLARPDVRMILSEPRGARVDFLRRVRESLGLEGVEVYPHKLDARYTGPVKGVISRAVGAIVETLDLAGHCLEPGGQMIFMKGPDCSDEIAAALETRADTFRLVLDQAYSIPETTHRRRLVVFERSTAPMPEARGGPRSAPPAFAGHSREITSESNPSYRRYLDLLTGAGIRKHGEAIIAGARPRDEIIGLRPQSVLAWLSGPIGPPPPDPAIPWVRMSEGLLKPLDHAGTRAPLIVVRAPEFERFRDEDPWPLGCTLFVPFQDPENVGAVIRSAAAFGVARVVLSREAAHPFHPRASRAAGPALFQVPLLIGPAIGDLSARDTPLIALDTSGTPLDHLDFPTRFGLVVGVEGPGLPERFRAGPRARIPIQPAVESLNAATATAVALYAWSTRAQATQAQGNPHPSTVAKPGGESPA